MKYITFFRENDDFNDIMSDTVIKKIVKEKTHWTKYLVLGIVEDDKLLSYITLKYGDNIITKHIKDYSPVPNVDYTPKKS